MPAPRMETLGESPWLLALERGEQLAWPVGLLQAQVLHVDASGLVCQLHLHLRAVIFVGVGV